MVTIKSCAGGPNSSVEAVRVHGGEGLEALVPIHTLDLPDSLAWLSPAGQLTFGKLDHQVKLRWRTLGELSAQPSRLKNTLLLELARAWIYESWWHLGLHSCAACCQLTSCMSYAQRQMVITCAQDCHAGFVEWKSAFRRCQAGPKLVWSLGIHAVHVLEHFVVLIPFCSKHIDD